MKPFSILKLSSKMLKNLTNLNYLNMTPIQEKTIPEILNGRDLIAQAKTGSGKTAAFGIGMLHNLNIKRYRVQAIVLCPTRELADQVTGELRRIARFEHNIKLVTITGGMPMYKQEHSLSHEAHIVVGTPGRVLKLLNRGSLVLDEVNTIILDEADRMLEMGFIDQVDEIMSYTKPQTQKLLFSATFPDTIKRFASSILNNPIDIKVDSAHKKSTIAQHFYEVKSSEKSNVTISILKEFKPESSIIFCNTKDACRRVKSALGRGGVYALALHGDIDQKQRTETLIRFTNGSGRVLVATDVAARGLDIDNLSAVINYDLPFETETYTHRIGRTGRAGKDGLSFSLMCPGEDFRIDEINRHNKENFRVQAYRDRSINTTKEELLPEMVTLSINGGRKQKISAGDILGALTSQKSITGKDIGKIDRLDYLTFVAVKREVSDTAIKILESNPIKGRSFKAMIND